MQTTLLWTGREYYSLENCHVTINDHGVEINSMIVGQYHDKIYRVLYTIKTNPAWETLFCEVQSQHNDISQHYKLGKDPTGTWHLNGQMNEQFNGCMEVDIPLTPFTNTLPIRRLQLPVNAEREIGVIYIDLLEQKISPVRQKYLRKSTGQFHYENVPNDFEADIEADKDGFVVDYPQLFVRTARYTW